MSNIPTLITPELINLYESAGLKVPYNNKIVEAVRKNSEMKYCLQKGIANQLKILDEQNAINRYRWYNLPDGISGELLERVLYYRGQGMFFYDEYTEKFYFLPYCLNGTIDVYGRFNTTKALPFNGQKEVDLPYVRDVAYDIAEDYDPRTTCVLLHDYSIGISQTNIARNDIQDPIITAMSEAFPMARTSLLSNSGIKGMRVNDQDQAQQVQLASEAITDAALTGNPWVPIVGNVEFQELTNGTPLKSAEYLQYFQALDNYRLSLYGLKNGGVFEKDGEYVNSITAGNIQQNVGLIMQDGLNQRQRFCMLVNAIWGLGIWCEISETVTNTDDDMNGNVEDNNSMEQQPSESNEQGGMEDGDV